MRHGDRHVPNDGFPPEHTIAPGIIDHKEWTRTTGTTMPCASTGWVLPAPSSLPFKRNRVPTSATEKTVHWASPSRAPIRWDGFTMNYTFAGVGGQLGCRTRHWASQHQQPLQRQPPHTKSISPVRNEQRNQNDGNKKQNAKRHL